MTSTTATAQAFGKSYGGTAPQNYERFFVSAIGAPLAADLIAKADLRSGERVLDVACGTGIVARLAAARVGPNGEVAALDINGGMLGVARSITPTSPAIRWYEAPAESIPLPDETFDVVLCQMGLQFMVDKVAALREMRRVLVPGGRVLVSMPTPTAFFDTLDDSFTRLLPAGSPFVRKVFSLNNASEIEQLFRDAGCGDVTLGKDAIQLRLPAARDFLWQYVHSTPLAGIVAGADEEALSTLERDVVAKWQPWVKDEGLAYQQDMIVATARK